MFQAAVVLLSEGMHVLPTIQQVLEVEPSDLLPNHKQYHVERKI
jgi:hypothetical protein